MDKYKELHNLALETYHEQHNRYGVITDKATKFFSILTLLIGLYGYLGKVVIDSLLKSESKVLSEYILIVIGIALFIMMIFAWFYLFRVLKLDVLVILPLTDETIKFYDDNRLVDIYYAMTKGMKDAMVKNEIIIEYKSKLLSKVYNLLQIYTFLFILFALFYILTKWEQIFN